MWDEYRFTAEKDEQGALVQKLASYLKHLDVNELQTYITNVQQAIASIQEVVRQMQHTKKTRFRFEKIKEITNEKRCVRIYCRKAEASSILREQPSWYRRLARRPMDIKEMEKEARQYYKQTLPHKVEQVVQTIEMAK